jgi:hypothetical protein
MNPTENLAEPPPIDALSSSLASRMPLPPRWSWKVYLLWSVPITAIYVYLGLTDPQFKDDKYIIPFAGPLVTAFFYWLYVTIKRAKYVQATGVHIAFKAEQLQQDLEKDFFTNLVKINFKYLDKYYLQTQVQGDKSFILCVSAAVVGLMIVITGIVMMFKNQNVTQPATVATAAGVLSQFIAAVFFYLYNKTILKMSDYHQKLVLTQNIAIALKISETLPVEDRTKAQHLLIVALTRDVNHLLVSAPSAAALPNSTAKVNGD